MEENIKLEKTKKRKFIFGKFRNIIDILKLKNNKVSDSKNSKFDDFLLEVDKKSDLYIVVKETISFCDKAINIARQRLIIINKIQMIDEETNELKCYNNLSKEDIDKLKDLVSKFISLNKDKSDLRYKIISFDKGLLKMEKLEKDAEFSLKNIEDAEQKKRILNHDLSFLKGEKLDLENEREELINLYNKVRKFSSLAIIIFSIIFVFLGFIRIFKGTSILLIVSLLCLLIIFIIVSIYIFKEKINKELIINLKKQHKAVELLNKKNVVYAYYTNFLNFVYNKYNVKNSNKLKQNIKEYGNYKNVTTRFDAIRDSLYDTEKDIEDFLRKNKIENSIITIEKFAKTINIEDKCRYYENLLLEKNRLEKKLLDLDKNHEQVWNEIIKLNNLDKTSDKIIDRIIQRYIDEVSKLANISYDYTNKEELRNMDKEIQAILDED